MRLLAFLAFVSLAGAAPTRSAIQIISTGEHHGDEVPAGIAGAWFALVDDGRGAFVRRVRVSVTRVIDGLLDEGNEMTGKRIDVSPRVQPIVLVRGIPGLKAGRVPTVAVNQSVGNETGVTLHIGAASYRLFVRCGEPFVVSGQRQEACDMLLWSAGVEQKLSTYGVYYEGDQRMWASEHSPNILWAGDLNADGRLDLLLDTSDHYNVDEMRLYLSTNDPASPLVSEAAVFTATGC